MSHIRVPAMLLAVVAIGCWGGGGSVNSNKVASNTSSAKKVPNKGPADSLILFLRADGRIIKTSSKGQILTPAEVTNALRKAAKAFGGSDAEEKSKLAVPPSEANRQRKGPEIRIVAEPQATHGHLDALLRTCVQCGCERFLLESRQNGRKYSFALRSPQSRKDSPDLESPPPFELRMLSDESGRLKTCMFNQRPVKDLAEVQSNLVAVLGDQLAPGAVTAELVMNCEPNLQLENVFDAFEAVSGYDNKDGKRITLIQHIRPVHWREDTQESQFEFEEIEPIE